MVFNIWAACRLFLLTDLSVFLLVLQLKHVLIIFAGTSSAVRCSSLLKPGLESLWNMPASPGSRSGQKINQIFLNTADKQTNAWPCAQPMQARWKSVCQRFRRKWPLPPCYAHHLLGPPCVLVSHPSKILLRPPKISDANIYWCYTQLCLLWSRSADFFKSQHCGWLLNKACNYWNCP